MIKKLILKDMSSHPSCNLSYAVHLFRSPRLLAASTYSFVVTILRNLFFLFSTSAPFVVYKAYFKNIVRRNAIEKLRTSTNEFQKLIQVGNFSSDYFSVNIPYWLMLFKKCSINEKNIKALEIGSWEGMSSLFILTELPKADLTCVDTWEGSDEQKNQDVLKSIETHFDLNLEIYKNRLTKFKGTSFSFFNSCNERAQFDLIYIDGSHYCDDVICDAIKGFEQLKVGGVMIFDDYFWNYYKRPIDNPAGAINAFLKLKSGTYELVSVNNQLIIRKLVSNDRPSLSNKITQ